MELRSKLAAWAVGCAACGGTPAAASIIRDGVGQGESAALGATPAFAAARLSAGGGVGSGTLVSPEWVLTAAHVVTDNAGAPLPLGSIGVSVGGETRGVAEVVVMPGWTGGNFTAGVDLALVRLSAAVAGTPAVVGFGPPPVGATATLVGFGAFGHGSSGYELPPGTLHGATNVIDGPASEFFPSWSSSLLLMDFDAPGGGFNRLGAAEPGALEGVPASGDSGGGSFVQVAGQWRLVGVHSFTFTLGGVASPGGYGTCAADVSVASAAAWIQGVIPGPGAAGLLAAAGVIVAQRSRKER